VTGTPIARATALIVLSSLGFGSLTTITLFVTRRGLPLLPAMVWRYFLAGVVFFLLVRSMRVEAVPRSRAFRLMLVGGLGQALITYLSLRALDYLPVGPLAFLFYTYPAWVALITAVTGRDRVTIPRVVALGLAMSGIAVMVGMPSAAALDVRGILLALGTALLYALYLPVLHKVQEGLPPLITSFYLVAGVFMAFLAASIVTGEFQLPANATVWVFVMALALVSTVMAFITLVAGLRILGPVRTSIVSTIEPFFTTMLGVFLLGEAFTVAIIAGGAMIAGAVILLQMTRGERATDAAG